jgi:NTE family protein
MAYPFTNLVFEGGGVKGVAYGGVLEVLDQQGILDQIQNVAGTSAGAIIKQKKSKKTLMICFRKS